MCDLYLRLEVDSGFVSSPLSRDMGMSKLETTKKKSKLLSMEEEMLGAKHEIKACIHVRIVQWMPAFQENKKNSVDILL